MKTPDTKQRSKRWLLAVFALLLALACFPVVNWAVPMLVRGEISRRADHRTGSMQEDSSQAPLKTRSSERPPAGPRATHGPQQFRDFFLPAQEINGLTLAEALNQLRTAYEATCRQTGETPLQVTFSLPSGNSTRIHLKLGRRTLENSIQQLAALAKLSVRRHGREYRFTAIPDPPGQQASASLDIPPDLQARLFPDSAGQALSAASLRQLLTVSGLALDPATRLTLLPGRLTIDTPSAADRAAISALIETARLNPPIQHKVSTKILEVPAAATWNYPDGTLLNDTQVQQLLREMARTKGVDLLTMPSVVARSDEPATMEIVNELITPAKGADGGWETHQVGVVVDLQVSPLGLGHRLGVNYTDTTGRIDPATGAAAITERAAIHNDSFSGDTTTRLMVQTHPDGTRIVLLVTPVLIDSSGRPRAESSP